MRGQCAVFSSADYGIVGLGQAGFTNVFDDVYNMIQQTICGIHCRISTMRRAWATDRLWGQYLYGNRMEFQHILQGYLYAGYISTGINCYSEQ